MNYGNAVLIVSYATKLMTTNSAKTRQQLLHLNGMDGIT